MKVIEVVRKAAASAVWSQGVRLVRQPYAVQVITRSDAEAELRVAAPAHPVPLSVTIYFGDVEWACNCGGTMDPCAHVVAAAIALESEERVSESESASPTADVPAASSDTGTHRADTNDTTSNGTSAASAVSSMFGASTAAGQIEHTPPADTVESSASGDVTCVDAAMIRSSREVARPSVPGVVAPHALGVTVNRPVSAARSVASRRRLGYRLLQESGVVWLTRVLVAPDGVETPLRVSLSSSAARALVMEIAPREQDLHLDRLMGSAAGKYRIGEALQAVTTVLEGAPDVRVGARVVRVSKDPVMPLVTLSEVHGELELRFERDPAIDEVIGAGLVRLGDELRPLGETERTGWRLERLPSVRRFLPSQSGELVNRILPELERKLIVEIKTDRLPGRVRTIKPHVEFELITEGEVLVARAVVVYGTPALARIVRGQLVQLGDRTPKRMLDAEKQLELALRDELDLLLDRPLRLEGLDAARFVDRLERWRRKHATTVPGAASERTVEIVPELLMLEHEPELVFHALGEPDIRVKPDVLWRAHLEGIEKLPLSDGSWGILPKGWLSRHADLLEDYLAARESVGDPKRAVRTLLGTSLDETEMRRPEGFEDYIERISARAAPELPPDVHANLRPYQLEGLRWLLSLRDAGIGGILADDMGLGKTLQTICALRGRCLIVMPKSVLYNWRQELQRFRPNLQVCVYHGANRYLDPSADVTLTSYAVMRLDQDMLSSIEWDIIVLDEAQTIKNAGSQATEAAFALRGKFRLALTGTPIENRLEELWSELQFVNPGLLGNLTSFRRRFVEPITAGDRAAAERLRRRVRPFVLRRLKADVAPDLPARTEDVLWVDLESDERQLYDAILSESRASVLPALREHAKVFDALEALLRLRQAACHSGLIPGRTAASSSKLQRLLESLEEVLAAGQKAIVFSQWTSLLDKVEPELLARSIGWVRLDGSTTNRQAVVEQFQDPAGPPILLASLKAGGTGLNLTAADHVYLLDPWWNPAAEAQAADRAHRIGRTLPVFIHRLIARETVEERVLALQERKRALGAFVDGADPTAALSREEIAELLD